MDVKTLLTLDEYMNLPDEDEHGDVRHELDEGELITSRPRKHGHTVVRHKVYEKLGKSTRLQIFLAAGYLLAPDPSKATVRQPDVSVVSKERLDKTDEESWVLGAPELAVEVVSPSDRPGSMERKVKQYLGAGAIAVWVLYPDLRHLHVHRSGQAVAVLTEEMTLTEPTLFPGWSIRVGNLFA
jgi:Uma2 family endonuclease